MIRKAKRTEKEKMILLSIWKALIREVTPNIRAVYVDWNQDTIHTYFFFDGEFTEEEEEDASCVETEMMSQIPDNILYELHCKRLDSPQPIVCPGTCVYKRKEVIK